MRRRPTPGNANGGRQTGSTNIYGLESLIWEIPKHTPIFLMSTKPKRLFLTLCDVGRHLEMQIGLPDRKWPHFYTGVSYLRNSDDNVYVLRMPKSMSHCKNLSTSGLAAAICIPFCAGRYTIMSEIAELAWALLQPRIGVGISQVSCSGAEI